MIIYRVVAWHNLEQWGKGSIVQAISKVQNQGLRAVVEAYWATPIRELEKEVLIPLIDIYYSEICAQHLQRIYSSSVSNFI